MKNINQKKLTKFCILSTQRSGSTWLRTLLGSHPEIKAFDEIFLPNELHRKWQKDLIPFYKFQESNSYKRPWVVFKYLDTLNDYPGEHKAIGYKLMLNHIRERPEIFVKMIASQFKIIHLVRNNYLDIIISREKAWGRSKKRVEHTTTDVKLEPIYLEPTLLIKDISQLEEEMLKAKLYLSFLPIASIQIQYEELCENIDSALNLISNFLNVSNSDINYQSPFKKINKGKYSEKIANYQEIKNLLAGTRYENLLIE